MKKKPLSSADSKEKIITIPIVAIGASAGGLDAMSDLLANLSPNTGLAFIYIHRNDPTHTHTTSIVDTLSRLTTMPVLEAQPGLPIEANHVYIIPADKTMVCSNGLLTLAKDGTQASFGMPIDQFFVSVADHHQNGSIGVILSGIDNDGTLGLKAIKAAGGITLVQDDSAKYSSMPASAINESVVDLILTPAEMAQEIERLSHRMTILDQTAVVDPQDGDDTADEDLDAIIQFIRKTVGVDFTQYKMPTIRRRIIRRMLLYKLETLREYVQYLKENPAEATILYNDLLINVTNFFRDPDLMDYLGKVLFPQLVKSKPSREPLRIWVPACSTGQEVYSLAMLLLETVGDRVATKPIHIFATDLSEMAIAKARLGIYTRSELADVSPRRLQQFFTKVEDQYRINKSIRDICVFAPHNLLKDPPFSRLDLISCRNLLIYLNTSLQRKAITSFHYALNPGGYLLLGKSESVNTSPTLFSPVEKNYKIYIRRNDVVSRVSFDRSSDLLNYRQESPIWPARPITLAGSPKPGTGDEVEKLVDKLLLSRYVPASVVVDQDLEILLFRGSISLFLEPAPGKASLNLLKMARPSLAFELRSLVHKARKSGKSIRKSGLQINVNGNQHQVAIEAAPIKTGTEQQLYLVIFEEIVHIPEAETSTITARTNRIKLLEKELESLREDMQSIIEEQETSNEELQSANEEIVSSNEELQSINEELETSKEEIESTNEELLMINQELQLRNDQLSESNEFADAIFGTIREATLGLDSNLRIKSANQSFYDFFQIREEETIGHLIYELDNHRWHIPKLRDLLEDVLVHNTFVKGVELIHTFPKIGERIMRLNARKVVQHQRQEAILLAIEDVTEDKRAQRLLAEREIWLRNVINNAPTLIWVSDSDGQYKFLNKAWLDYTAHSPADPVDWVQRIHPTDRSLYLAIYYDHLANRQPYQAEYRLMRSDGEYRWLLEHATPTIDTEGNFGGYIGSCVEMHSQKILAQELDNRVQLRAQELSYTNEALGRANLELTQTADRLQSVLNGVPAAIKMLEVVLDLQGNPIDFTINAYNNLALELTEQSKPILNKRLLDVHPWMKEAGLIDLSFQVYTTGKPAYRELYLDQVKPGYYAFAITPQIDSRGVVETIINITARKNAEERMRTTAENLQVVLDSSPAAIGFLRAVRNNRQEIVDFRLVVYNQKFTQLSKSLTETGLDQPLTHLAPLLWQDDTLAKLAHIVNTSESAYEERIIDTPPFQSPKSEKWLGLSITKQDDGLVLTGLDITAIKESEEQQSQLLKELSESEDSLQDLAEMRQHMLQRGELLRSTTHDLRGSFGIIQGAASLLDYMNTEEERAQMLTMLQRNLRQVTQMLTQLLDYSRLESGQEQVVTASFDVAILLHEIKDSMIPTANDNGLWLRTEGPKKLVVESDAVKVQRIAQNLILNALKYTQTGGVTITWKKEMTGSGWQFSVQDTGPGLPSDFVTLLDNQSETISYERLEQRASSSTGEGIGLFIVKRLTQLLGATLTVNSQPDVGTHFQVRFP